MMKVAHSRHGRPPLSWWKFTTSMLEVVKLPSMEVPAPGTSAMEVWTSIMTVGERVRARYFHHQSSATPTSKFQTTIDKLAKVQGS